MSERPSPFVFDAAAANFDALIRGNSMRGLVLAHFWSPKAGPCMILMPRLVALAAQYGGRFLLVMVNTDGLGRQARDLGVTSVPTVKFFLRGEVVHTIHGAEPDRTFHEALARFLATPGDRARLGALTLHQAGRTPEAIEALARLAVDDPADLAVAVDLAKLLTLDGREDEALYLLASLPQATRQSPDVAYLLAHLELLQAAQGGPKDADPTNPDSRLTLAARALFEDDMELALSHLLELAHHAPEFREDIGRRSLLALFAMLGPEHPLARRYRSELLIRHD